MPGVKTHIHAFVLLVVALTTFLRPFAVSAQTASDLLPASQDSMPASLARQSLPIEQSTIVEQPIFSEQTPCAERFVSWIKATHLYAKSNALSMAMMVPNLTLEWELTPFCSLNIPFYGSFWDYGGAYTKFRVVALQPEFRVNVYKGVFLGFHGGFAFYNVSMNAHDFRYQDNSGAGPLWNVGYSLGYKRSLSSNGRWGIEASLGWGYADYTYDRFYNVPNGKYIDSARSSYWGIDQLTISVTYKIR